MNGWMYNSTSCSASSSPLEPSTTSCWSRFCSSSCLPPSAYSCSRSGTSQSRRLRRTKLSRQVLVMLRQQWPIHDFEKGRADYQDDSWPRVWTSSQSFLCCEIVTNPMKVLRWWVPPSRLLWYHTWVVVKNALFVGFLSKNSWLRTLIRMDVTRNFFIRGLQAEPPED